MKRNMVIIGAVALALVVGGLGTAWLTGARPFDDAKTPAAQVEKPIATATAESRFVTLDKLIVMLRAPDVSRSRYLAMDLVFQTNAKQEKQVQDQLPLLRSTAHRALSGYTVEDIRGMGVDGITSLLEEAYATVYGGAQAMPFTSVRVGRQMVE